MIHAFIGTKAQFIKMAPVLLEMDRRGGEYNFIDSGQHAALSEPLRRAFGLREPDCRLGGQKDLTSLPELVWWALRTWIRSLLNPRRIFETVFKGQGGICLVHGDTLTTLLSVRLAKRCGLRVAHVEAGLRSRSWFHPFPEELIRVYCMRRADILFAPGQWAVENLKRMKARGKVINLGDNTIVDTLKIAREAAQASPPREEPFGLVTLHRYETIRSRKTLNAICEVLLEVSERTPLFFVQHKPTLRYLKKFGLQKRLEECPGIRLLPMQDYPAFQGLLAAAVFVMTDGGSIQEECAYWGVPCLLLRRRTERPDGIGANVVLSDIRREKMLKFAEDSEKYRREPRTTDGHSPSQVLVETLLNDPACLR